MKEEEIRSQVLKKLDNLDIKVEAGFTNEEKQLLESDLINPEKIINLLRKEASLVEPVGRKDKSLTVFDVNKLNSEQINRVITDTDVNKDYDVSGTIEFDVKDNQVRNLSDVKIILTTNRKYNI